MKQTPKQFFSTQAGKLTLALVAMVLCWTFLLVYLSKISPGGTWFPTKNDMTNVRRQITKAMNDLSAEEKKLQAFEALKKKYDDSLTAYWNADRDGEPETELRNLVNAAAQNAGANLQTLGSVRTSTINSELSYADLDFTLVDEYDKVIRFFAEIEKCTPRLSWRRVEIRVEPVRARAVTGPGARQNNTTAAATTTPAQMFRTSGQVRVIKYTPAAPSTKSTAKSSGKSSSATPKTTTQPQSATKPAATSTTPAAQQPSAPADGAPAAAESPAQKESAATPTPNKENEK